MVGVATNGCQRFGDFGCAGYLLMGIYAVPISAIGGGLVGGINTAATTRRGQNGRRARIWRNGLLLAILSGFLSASGFIILNG